LRDLDAELQNLYTKSKFYHYAQGGRNNLFQFFYPLAIDSLKNNGICSLITQNSLLAEDSALSNRKLIFDRCRILKIDSFPERDNVNLRVFASAKMSVCICTIQKGKMKDYGFTVNIWKDRYMSDSETLKITDSEIRAIYPDDLIIPICSNEKWELLNKINRVKSYHLTAQAGEIDMTKYKPLFTDNRSLNRVLTGAQVLRYEITDNPSQGKVNYLPLNQIKLSDARLKAIGDDRIVMQRITGVDSKIRIISTLVQKGVLCANSTNYISKFSNPELPLEYILAILNSKLINFYFKQTSTNTNVTGKEVGKLPIVITCQKYTDILISKVKAILAATKAESDNLSLLEKEVDLIVYHLYNITYDELLTIDSDTSITYDEYENYKLD
jgi:Alw26I/Eco31I/Esp3I family type II restriction m6 adenine DNA methyltransferase